MAFTLHPQLEKDTTRIGEFPLCSVLLARDDSIPWLILVPKVDGIRELHHLPMEKQHQFLLESQAVCLALETLFKPDKINIAALGNMVPQLHIHHVARFISDLAWPGPIWGNNAGVFRSEGAQLALMHQLSDQLAKEHNFIPG